MVSNQVLGARALASFLILSAVCGCAHQHAAATAPAAAPVSSADSTATAAPQDMTATEAAIANAGSSAPVGSAGPADDTRGAVLATAPMRYTVKRGDTLWGIASMYLKDPWLWPEVWVINPQIPNPHLIYPGDTLALAYGADGSPSVCVIEAGTVRLDPRLRSTPFENAIPTITYASIAAFLSRPTVMTSDEIKNAPYVLAFRDLHQVAGSGSEVYINNLTTATENSRYAVIHVATKLVDPDDGKVVGYEGIYTATALVQRPGTPAKALLIDPARETLSGDRLVSADTDTPVMFTLRAAGAQVKGRILDVVAGADLIGSYDVVVINRGQRDGITAGNILAVDQAGDKVPDLYRGGRQIDEGVDRSFAPKVQLPSERTGTLLVFKVFDRVSYGLVVGAADAIHVGDFIRSPQAPM
jgi:LysM repeat protein